MGKEWDYFYYRAKNAALAQLQRAGIKLTEYVINKALVSVVATADRHFESINQRPATSSNLRGRIIKNEKIHNLKSSVGGGGRTWTSSEEGVKKPKMNEYDKTAWTAGRTRNEQYVVVKRKRSGSKKRGDSEINRYLKSLFFPVMSMRNNSTFENMSCDSNRKAWRHHSLADTTDILALAIEYKAFRQNQSSINLDFSSPNYDLDEGRGKLEVLKLCKTYVITNTTNATMIVSFFEFTCKGTSARSPNEEILSDIVELNLARSGPDIPNLGDVSTDSLYFSPTMTGMKRLKQNWYIQKKHITLKPGGQCSYSMSVKPGVYMLDSVLEKKATAADSATSDLGYVLYNKLSKVLHIGLRGGELGVDNTAGINCGPCAGTIITEIITDYRYRFLQYNKTYAAGFTNRASFVAANTSVYNGTSESFNAIATTTG